MKPDYICGHLRNKKMYITDPHEDVFAKHPEGHDSCCPCWCDRTMAPVGPDDRQVGWHVCRPGRLCFES